MGADLSKIVQDETVRKIEGLVTFIKRGGYMTRVVEGPLRIGGYNPTRKTGDQNYVEISITPYDSNCPVKSLEFHGVTGIQTGDSIRAGISMKQGSYIHTTYYPREDRTELKEREIAAYLHKLDGNNNILEEDLNIDYHFEED